MPKEVVETTDNNDEVVDTLDEVQGEGVATPAPIQSKQKGSEGKAKLEFTEEEFQHQVQVAVQSELQGREETARREEAVKQGNYENLYNEAQERIHELELNSWKNKALTKFKLSEDFFEALSGSTEEEVIKSAKRLKGAIDAEVAQVAQTATPPPGGKRSAPRDAAAVDMTQDILKRAFIPRSIRRH